MLKENTAVLQQRESTEQQACLGAEVDRLAVATIFGAAGLVGLWTAARIGFALYAGGGPAALFIKAWLGAVTSGAM